MLPVGILKAPPTWLERSIQLSSLAAKFHFSCVSLALRVITSKPTSATLPLAYIALWRSTTLSLPTLVAMAKPICVLDTNRPIAPLASASLRSIKPSPLTSARPSLVPANKDTLLAPMVNSLAIRVSRLGLSVMLAPGVIISMLVVFWDKAKLPEMCR